jgi:hypothetical protein
VITHQKKFFIFFKESPIVIRDVTSRSRKKGPEYSQNKSIQPTEPKTNFSTLYYSGPPRPTGSPVPRGLRGLFLRHWFLIHRKHSLYYTDHSGSVYSEVHMKVKNVPCEKNIACWFQASAAMLMKSAFFWDIKRRVIPQKSVDFNIACVWL